MLSPQNLSWIFNTQINNMCWWAIHKPADQQNLSFALALAVLPPCTAPFTAPSCEKLLFTAVYSLHTEFPHWCSGSKSPTRQLQSGVLIPTWWKDPAGSGSVTTALWSAPTPGKGGHRVVHATQLSL